MGYTIRRSRNTGMHASLQRSTMCLRWIQLAIIILLPLLTQAQEKYAIHIHSGMGLPSNTVYNLHQDQRGFIWIATEKGLCRFDGVRFTSFQCNSMSTKSGSYIKEDQHGTIWYSNFDGYLFSVHQEEMHPLNNKASQVLDFALIGDTLWVVSDSLNAYQIRTQKKLISKPIQESFTIYQQGDHFTISGIKKQTTYNVYNRQGEIVKSWIDPNWEIYKILEYQDANLFLKNKQDGIEVEWKINDEMKASFRFADNGQYTGAGLIGDTLWICTKKGLRLLDLKKQKTYSLMENEVCTYLIQDRQQNLWVSTLNGIYLFPARRQFQHHPLPSPITRLRTIQQQLYLYDNEGRITTLDTTTSRLNTIWQSSKHASIYTFLYANSPGTYQQVQSRRPQVGEYFAHQGREYLIMNSGVKNTAILNKKYLVSVTSTNVEMIDYSTTHPPDVWDSLCKVYQTRVEQRVFPYTSSFPTGRNRALAVDTLQQEFFSASGAGLWHFTPHGFDTILWQGQPVMASGLFIFKSKLFILLHSGQLLMRWQDGRMVALSETIRADDFKIIGTTLFWWTGRTIYWKEVSDIDSSTASNQFKSISIPYEFSEIVDVAYVKDQLFISTPYKLLIAGLNNMGLQNASKLPFYLLGLRNQNKTFQAGQEPVFESNPQDIQVSFAIPDYLYELNDLAYQMNEEPWKLLTPQTREISFASLAPGSYRIRFRLNGQIRPETLQFSVRKPFYQQFWFLGFVVCAASGLIYLWYRYRLQRQQKENALILEKANLEKDLRQSMLSSIKSQMNPHFLFNALNTIQSYIISEDKKNASAYLSKFSKLTRRILEMSEKESILLQEELDALLLYIELEKMRFDELHYFIEIAPNVQASAIRIPSMIIQPYVENAIKHGLMHRHGSRHLYLRFDVYENQLRIQIEDNGVGRKRSSELNAIRKQNHQSFSTDANLKRIELLNYEKNHIAVNYTDKMDTEGNPQGTLVTIQIPLNLTV